ncbi:MAG: PAS domain-containing protein, partial [Planctomycetes bacterium]|nr:PAS domain-containing protein [Planctomycetota bacterium]
MGSACRVPAGSPRATRSRAMPNGASPLSPPPSDPLGGRGGVPRGSTPARIAGAYFVFGALWIWLSDLALRRAGVQGAAGFWASAGKGTAFVLLSTLLVLWVARREFRALARANALLRAVAEGTPDVVFLKDRAGRYLLVNEAAARLVGRSVAEVLGKDDAELFDAASARLMRESDREVMATGRAKTVEGELTTAGAPRTFLGTKAPYRDADGTVLGVIGTARDITERKEAERQLRAERDRFEKIVEAVPGAICSFELRPDGSARFPYASRHTERIYGVAPQELARTAAPVFERMHPDDVGRVRAAIEESARTLSLWRAEYRVNGPGRGEIWVEGCSAPVRQPDGSVLWHGHLSDVTDRKRTERALRESEERLKEAQRIARMGRWTWEPGTGRAWWSDAIYALYGVDRVALVPGFDAFLALVHPDDRSAITAGIEAVRAGADRFASD